MFKKFSEHAIIPDLNFNEQLGFCTFSINIHVLNFDPRAFFNRTYEEKNICRCVRSSSREVVKLLACQEIGPGFDLQSRRHDFRNW